MVRQAPAPTPRPDRGISLIEVMVALTILSTVLITLGGLMFDVARQTRRSAATTYRAAAVQSAQAWIDGLPWSTIDSVGFGGCTADSSGLLAYDQCVQVADTTTTLKRVQVVISPTGNLLAPPDTLIVYRSTDRPSSPLQ